MVTKINHEHDEGNNKRLKVSLDDKNSQSVVMIIRGYFSCRGRKVDVPCFCIVAGGASVLGVCFTIFCIVFIFTSVGILHHHNHIIILSLYHGDSYHSWKQFQYPFTACLAKLIS